MENKGRSVTAEGVAIQRALHQTLDPAPKIFDDPIAPLLVDLSSASNQANLAAIDSITRPIKSPLRAVFIMRSRYTEDCLAESLVRGVRQYVILGAGLDTFAYRQPDWGNSLQIYEVDHPASQEWKRERLAEAKVRVPGNLIFAPIDFEITSLREGLASAGFNSRTPSFFSLLGVSQYLTAEALDSVFGFVQAQPQGSELVFEFIVPDDLMPRDEAGVFRAIASFAADRGEPWLTRLRPEELQSKLTAFGFSQVYHLSPQAADELYFQGRSDDLAAWSGAQMMRAIV